MPPFRALAVTALCLTALAGGCASDPFLRVQISARTDLAPIYQLAVTAHRGTHGSTVMVPPTPAAAPLAWPRSFALDLPDGLRGTVRIDVAGLGAGGALAAGGVASADVTANRVYDLAVALDPGHGSGADGPLAVDSGVHLVGLVHTVASGTSGSSTLAVASSDGFAAGDLVLVHDSQGAAAGRWETAVVAATQPSLLALTAPLIGDYPSTDRAQALRVPQHTDVHVAAGATLGAPAWDGQTGGILALYAAGTVVIDGVVEMSGSGYRGARHDAVCPMKVECIAGLAGESPGGAGAMGPAANGSGGGGGEAGDCNVGGGGGHGTAGSTGPGVGANATCSNAPVTHDGAGGTVAGSADLASTLLFGGAGGEGGADNDGSAPGAGGSGGGIVLLVAGTIRVNAGSVRSNGSNGGDGSGSACTVACGEGGGGGGAGGAIWLVANTVSLGSGQVTAGGGAGGSCALGANCTGVSWTAMSRGGSGGAGRISVRAAARLGSTNPPAGG